MEEKTRREKDGESGGTDKQKCRTTVKKKEISRTENLEEVRTEGREGGDGCRKAEKGDVHIETMYTNNTEKQNRY